MVALTQWIEEKQPDVVAGNRVWDFLGDTPGSVRQTAAQVADCDWEKGLVDYDWRRVPSLAQSGEGAKIAILRVDSVLDYRVNDKGHEGTKRDVESLIDDLDGNWLKNIFVKPVLDENDSILYFRVRDLNDIDDEYSGYDAVFVFSHGDLAGNAVMIVGGRPVYMSEEDWIREFREMGIDCKGVQGCINEKVVSGTYDSKDPATRLDNSMRQVRIFIMVELRKK
ncbi:MAG: hypothetical protein R3F07_11400 [Opitutaceae bacterium]